MKKLLTKYSFLATICCAIFISLFRINNVNNKELSWDVLGYYMHLPSTFIHNDPLLNDYSWLKELNEEKQLTGTLYQISSNQKGEPMYFFLFGMSYFYAPFFFAGHTAAKIFDYPTDGFSMPYQYALVIGGILFTLIGLWFLRKILTHFFNGKISALVILITVFGTNYIHHLTLKNLETVNVLFMLVSIITWFTIKWHQTPKTKYMVIIGLAIVMAGLVKPSEVIILLLPLLWNVTSKQDFKDKIQLLLKHKKSIFITIGVAFLVALPQMIYWQIKTGFFIFDSYKNPGVGLDLWSPHILKSLFSYRKGWLLYTPVMIFSLIGFYHLYKRNKKIFYPIAIYFGFSLYIIVSWSEWWYGAGFSNRPTIAMYPLLAITLGYFLLWLKEKSSGYKIITSVLITAFICLNQFQWWQLKNYILDPVRTTKEYYWATFLKTKIPDNAEKLKLFSRDYSGSHEFKNPEMYKSHEVLSENYNETKDSVLTVLENVEFTKADEFKFKKLTKKDHIWIKASFDIQFTDSINNKGPYFVMTMQRLLGSYGYYAPEIKALNNNWQHVEYTYLTPEIRSKQDKFRTYFWNANKRAFKIDNFKLEIYERTY